ncbi:DNA polymerase delta subunit 3-like [Vicia villosa]|uniref:DNA polymerase delta subunit 3-like n=1 Tax=Vicia villosa TaxID=3911 RepID=UPI00273AD0FF|nr:DNA polymerase delta subunit 3-like [Vicia villosa]
MGDLHHHLQNQEDHILIPNSHNQQENNDLYSMLNPNSSSTSTHHHHHKQHSSSTKRRSPPSSSTLERSAKKHSFDQEDFTRNGFSAITLPFSLHGNVLRRCISNPEQSAVTPMVKGAGLPPLHPNLRRCLSADAKSVSRALSSEESAPADSMRLKRMKDRLKEMKQWWDEVMKEEDEEVEEEQQQQEEEQEEKEQSPVVEEDKVLSQDELGEDVEEAVRVEWAEKCLSLTFKCPCSKGYEVLISANNCYYKLV